jgi:hypothetical protein
MREHFNCLNEIESTHGDLSNAGRLREVLRQNNFLLGLEASKNKNMGLELKTLQRRTDRLRDEKFKI